jgi:hypothetical protein
MELHAANFAVALLADQRESETLGESGLAGAGRPLRHEVLLLFVIGNLKVVKN